MQPTRESNFLVSIVIPCKNEEATLVYSYETLLDWLSPYDYEIIFIDDGSSDNTPALMKTIGAGNKRVKIIRFKKNYGQQAAFLAGLRNATGNCIILLDADLQTPAELIPRMISLWMAGHSGIFSTYSHSINARFWKRTTANLFYRIYNFFGRSAIPQNMGNMLLVDSCYRNTPVSLPLVKAGLFGAVGNKTMVHYTMEPRKFGETKFGYPAMLRNGLLNILVAMHIPFISHSMVRSYLYYEIDTPQ